MDDAARGLSEAERATLIELLKKLGTFAQTDDQGTKSS
jgi:hypothetical protein